jgi:hypothetical protein
MSIRLAVALLASLISVPCFAKEATVGQTAITLTTPTGQCELDPKQPSDARMLQITEGALTGVGNRLLAFYADCKQLGDWRTGKRPLLEDFAQYQTTIAAAGAPAPAAPEEEIKQLCSKQRADGERTMSGLASDIKARVEEAVRGVKVNQMRFLGVVGEEPGACYAALVQRLKAETGKDVTMMSVYATMFIKGKVVHYYLYSPYRSSQTVTALLARHKVNVAALLAANKKMALGPERAGRLASGLASGRRSW